MMNDDELLNKILSETNWPSPSIDLKSKIMDSISIEENIYYSNNDNSEVFYNTKHLSAFFIAIAFSFMLGTITNSSINNKTDTESVSIYTGAGTMLAYRFFD